MVNLPYWEILKKLGSKLFSPKDQKPLKDSSFRQTAILGKIVNKFVVVLPSKKDAIYIGDIKKIPDYIIDKIQTQYEEKEDKAPKIRLIKNEFYEGLLEYQAHYKKEEIINKILPYLESEYRSILKLSSYVKELLDKAKHVEAQEIKRAIGIQYGGMGRRLCNLYIQSYVLKMLKEDYIKKIFDLEKSTLIKEEVNKLIKRIIKDSEYVFFINPQQEVDEVIGKIRDGLVLSKPLIALHSAGCENFSKTFGILQTLEKDIKKYGYEIKEETPDTPALCFIYNVYLIKK